MTCFFRGLINIFEYDLKKMVALRTLSQISLCFLIFIFNMIFFSYFHLVRHALFKSCLFIQLGIYIYYSYRQQIFKNMFLKNILFLYRFFLLVICLIGLFFNNGILTKDIFLEFFIMKINNYFIMIIIFFSIIFTLFYSIIFIKNFYNKIIFYKINNNFYIFFITF